MRLSYLKFPPKSQLTPKQKVLLQDERLTELISRLDLQVQPSPEFKRATEIEKRVTAWITEISSTTIVPREIKTPPTNQKPWDPIDLTHIKIGEAPF